MNEIFPSFCYGANAISVVLNGDQVDLLSPEDFSVVYSTPNTHGARERVLRVVLNNPTHHDLFVGGCHHFAFVGLGWDAGWSTNGILFASYDQRDAYESSTRRGFAGCVLGIREHNGYHDSDFFATVWDPVFEVVRVISDGTTRAYAPSCIHHADASEEVKAKANAWKLQAARPGARAHLEKRALTPRAGRKVRVVKGRKVKVGTEGWIVREADTQFGKSVLIAREGTAGRQFGIPAELESGKNWQWTPIENVAVVDPKPVTEEDVTAEVLRMHLPY